jgi:hypothetical protein
LENKNNNETSFRQNRKLAKFSFDSFRKTKATKILLGNIAKEKVKKELFLGKNAVFSVV